MFTGLPNGLTGWPIAGSVRHFFRQHPTCGMKENNCNEFVYLVRTALGQRRLLQSADIPHLGDSQQMVSHRQSKRFFHLHP